MAAVVRIAKRRGLALPFAICLISVVVWAGSAWPAAGAALPAGWPEDARSTSGPVPPPGLFHGYSIRSAAEPGQGQKVLSGMPAYIWYRGCGPASAGMIIGYWDAHGFPALLPGNADSQTQAANDMISSQGNWVDYCLPVDYDPKLLPDRSEPPPGDEHPDDSIADFMKTSQSARGNYYGWTWFSDADDAFTGYVSKAAPTYTCTSRNESWSTFTWETFRAEIDAGRPVMLLVDTDGNGGTDHFVPAFGYDETGSTRLYACYDTWDTSLHWYAFAQMARGQAWGIYGATLVSLQRPSTLDVQSVPVAGIAITGTKPGTTGYTAACSSGEVVDLAAPATATVQGVRYEFVRWMLDGVDQPPGLASLRVTMGVDHAATAAYGLAPMISIRGPSEVVLSGGGTFAVDVYGTNLLGFAGMQAALTFIDEAGNDAGFLVSTAGGDPVFGGMNISVNAAIWSSFFPLYGLDRRVFGFMSAVDSDIAAETWMLTVTYDYGPGARGRYSIVTDPRFTVVANGLAEAIQFQEASGRVTILQPRQLAVGSSPVAGVAVAGTKPGTTAYAATCYDQQVIDLAVPAQVTLGGVDYSFIGWAVDGAGQPEGQTAIRVTMDADHAIASRWTVAGDANGDCEVNVLDLIAIRNKLGQDPATADNWKADVNGDGKIDVLDLVFTRNRMGRKCPN